jgi:hypothetical protein
LRVQLKGRLLFDKKYIGKELFVCFPTVDGVYLYTHDDLLNLVLADGRAVVGTVSWDQRGNYHFPSIATWLQQLLQPYFLPAVPAVVIDKKLLFARCMY